MDSFDDIFWQDAIAVSRPDATVHPILEAAALPVAA
jgi:hypothetical protein